MALRSAVLCRRCRKLVSADDPVCPYCGISRPGAWWGGAFARLNLFDPDQVVRQLIYLNVAMYLVSLLFSSSATRMSSNPFGFVSPSDGSLLLLGATGTGPIAQLGRWWTLLSANYLHGGLLHIFFNMAALNQLGPVAVREYGAHRMFVIYTLGGIAGFWVSYLAGVRFTIGASAAVCALIGAMLYYGRHRGGTYGRAIFQSLWGWAIGIFLFGLVAPGINNWGHGGGMAAGLVLGSLLGYQERRRETRGHKLFAWWCLAATLAALVWGIGSALWYSLRG